MSSIKGYHYTALSENGQVIREKTFSSSIHTLRNDLQQKKLHLLKAKPFKESPHFFSSSQSLLTFTQSLKSLVQSKIPLLESLQLMKEQFKPIILQGVIASLEHSLQSGNSLARSMQLLPSFFPTLYVQTIEAAETAGSMDEALEFLFEHLKRKKNIKKQLISKLSYPLLISVLGLILFQVTLYVLLPELQDLFSIETLDVKAKFIFELGAFFRSYQLFIFSLLIFFSLAFFAFIKTDKGKKIVSKALLKKPFRLLTEPYYFYHLCAHLALLLKADLPLNQALSLAHGACLNSSMAQWVNRAQNLVLSGKSLTEAFSCSSIAPQYFLSYVSLHEKTGHLKQCFEDLKNHYQMSFEQRLGQCSALLSPILLIMMAIFIMLLAFGILIPLTTQPF